MKVVLIALLTMNASEIALGQLRHAGQEGLGGSAESRGGAVCEAPTVSRFAEYPQGVAVSGDVACVVAGEGGLWVLKASEADPIALLAHVDSDDELLDVDTDGLVAVVAIRDFGIALFDVSKPAEPTEVGRLQLGDGCSAVTLVGDLVYASVAGDVDVSIVSIAVPTAPTVVSELEVGVSDFDWNRSVEVQNGRAYLSNRYGLEIYDVSDPSSVVLLGRDGGTLTSFVEVRGSIAYCGHGQLFTVLDISDPGNITELWRRRWSVSDISGIHVQEDRVYVANANGLTVLDVSDPASVTEVLRSWTLTMGATAGVASDGERVWILDYEGGVTTVGLGKSDTVKFEHYMGYPGNPWGVSAGGAFSFVSDWENQIVVVDHADPELPQVVGHFEQASVMGRSMVQAEMLFVTGRGLQIFDITDPTDLMRLAWDDVGGQMRNTQDVFVSDTTAFVAAGSDGFWSVDVSDPADPQALDSIDIYGIEQRVVVQGDIAYVSALGGGLSVVDVSDPSKMSVVGMLPYSDDTGYVHEARIERTLLYVSTELALLIVDVGDPTNPTPIGRFDLPVSAIGVPIDIGNGVAALAPYEGELLLVDVSRPRAPRLISSGPMLGTPLQVSLDGELLHIADLREGYMTIQLDNCLGIVCSADLTLPFGVLNFDDVLAFLTAFGAMDPAADLAEPYGEIDFDDVLAFLVSFGSGCP